MTSFSAIRIACASVAMALTMAAGAASAATVTVDFSSGMTVNKAYIEDGFTFTSSSGGGITTPNTCGSPCLLLRNNEEVTVTFAGGLFSIDSFQFIGESNDVAFSLTGSNMDTDSFSETLPGNNLATALVPNKFNGILFATFTQVDNGSSRIDNITFTVPDVPPTVPLPAAGLMLLSGIGVIGAMRRRRNRG